MQSFYPIWTKTSNKQKYFLTLKAAIKALDNNVLSSSLVKQITENLNLPARQTSRVEICWIKAHIGHAGNERADQLAREASSQRWPCVLRRAALDKKSRGTGDRSLPPHLLISVLRASERYSGHFNVFG